MNVPDYMTRLNDWIKVGSIECARLEAERNRLRTALSEIETTSWNAMMSPTGFNRGRGADRCIGAVHDIARAARLAPTVAF